MPGYQTPTGGVPLKAQNAWMMEGNTALDKYTGGDLAHTSEDYTPPAHPGQPQTNAKKVLEKAASQLRLDQVMPKKDAEKLLADLDRDRRDLLDYVRTEMAFRHGKVAGEEREPTPDRHPGAPSQHIRPRAEVLVFTPDGAYGIDKGDYMLFPGGGVDDGEPAMIAAIRESIEEADLQILNIDQKDVVESIWPEDSGNEFWDDSEFSGERTYFFTGIDGGRLGTQHKDREDFKVIPYDTLLSRLDEIIADEGQSWAKRNNEVRRNLIEAAQGMASSERAFKPKKLAKAKKRKENWGEYRNTLRRVFMPVDREAFIAGIREIEEEMDHHCDLGPHLPQRLHPHRAADP